MSHWDCYSCWESFYCGCRWCTLTPAVHLHYTILFYLSKCCQVTELRDMAYRDDSCFSCLIRAPQSHLMSSFNDRGRTRTRRRGRKRPRCFIRHASGHCSSQCPNLFNHFSHHVYRGLFGFLLLLARPEDLYKAPGATCCLNGDARQLMAGDPLRYQIYFFLMICIVIDTSHCTMMHVMLMHMMCRSFLLQHFFSLSLFSLRYTHHC